MDRLLLELGWYIEIVSLPNIKKIERRYYKEGFEINEDLMMELLSVRKANK